LIFAEYGDRSEKRREDSRALEKLRETDEGIGWILHEALSECDESSHRFHFDVSTRMMMLL
jgi:hypothetical protein